MFGSTLWLTLATLAGLVAGFAREWLLVAAWGAGSRSDGFLVAVFLPEGLPCPSINNVMGNASKPGWPACRRACSAWAWACSPCWHWARHCGCG